MQVFIDFDYTLCNTALVKNAIHALPQKYSWDEERFFATERAVTEAGHYSLQEHLKVYGGIAPDESRAIETELFTHAKEWLYSDSIDFLKRNSTHTFTIISLGDASFQHAKILASGVCDFVSGLDCVSVSKENVIGEYIQGDEPFLFIDDRPLHLDSVAQKFPHAKCVRMSRPESPYLTEVSHNTTLVVTDLSWSVEGV